jgi:hypothetical protein
VRAAVDHRLERHAAVVDLDLAAEREDLVAAAVGQDRSVPAHEAVQAAESLDAFGTGPHVQVVAVGEDQLGAGRLHLFGRQALQRRVGADRREARRLERTVRRVVAAAPQLAVRAEQFEAEGAHANGSSPGRAFGWSSPRCS